ncbi:FAD:protein FMN transferase [Neolewinella lacunae]|uniref:FAD:protein FMN transferase n=1 Tax=Neolewinella lacunae TaxID=1517758 RepID=A0A923PPL4_9BACT|nr:FAD:protein FMN transferase [Neolewinella lacunae]MBC6995461.1 FAD:protein FMN transferase [Neolewinella lacunae]MDN3635049.1 FAD:protein FMN transferase [Neolewinella lacunae]
MRFYLPLLLVLFFCTCDRAPATQAEPTDTTPQESHLLTGEAMGSYYRVTYLGDSLPGLRARIDSLLTAYNAELSAWVPTSKLNAFNQSERGIDLAGTRHFIPNLELARRASEATGGAYDPTVAPLVRFWGFGTGKPRESANFDPAEVDRLRQLVGMDRIRLEGQFLHKEPGTELDLNASAKGFGVDLLSQLLTSAGRPDHLIDIGGEMRGGGTKNGKPWNVAIRLPDEDRSKVSQAGTLPLSNGRAIATSGNYLSYYTVDGETFSHTINPKTGLVERNRLLSASILAPDCATADAFATACMVLGPAAALELVENTPELDGYFLVRAEDGGLEIRKSSGLN